MTEERKREILENLQWERELRRKRAQQMNLGQPYPARPAEADPIDSLSSIHPAPNDTKPLDVLNTEDFKDPNDILMAQPEESAPAVPEREFGPRPRDADMPQPRETETAGTGRSPSPDTAKRRTEDPPSRSTSKPSASPPSRRVFDNELMKECLEYSTHSGRETPSEHKARSKTPGRREEESPRAIQVRPQEPPRRVDNLSSSSSASISNRFAFDRGSKVGQEIQKKYGKPLVDQSQSQRQKSIPPVVISRTPKPEVYPQSHPPPQHNFKMNRERRKSAIDKENPPTYMRPTALAELRAAAGAPTHLPEKLRRVAEEEERKLKEQCTFQPRVNVAAFSSKLELNREERLSRLYKPRTTEIQKREKLKQQQDEEEFARVCTFQPRKQVHSTSFFEVKARLDDNETPVDRRLFGEAVKRLDDKRKAYKEKEHRDLSECTFQPNIAQSTKAVKGNRISDRPIYERVNPTGNNMRNSSMMCSGRRTRSSSD